MKKSFFLSILALGLIFTACHIEDENHLQPECSGNCLFALKNAKGVVVYMEKYGRYAIKTEMSDGSGDGYIYGIIEGLGSDFQVEGLEVEFSAAFLPNKMAPISNDPNMEGGQMFEIKLVEIKLAN